MAAYQTTYPDRPAKGLHGASANEELKNDISRTIENAAGVRFGEPVQRGAGDHGVVPFAAAGAAIGGWAGPALALVGIGTAPAWAVPVAIGGGVVAVGGALAAAYKFAKSRSKDTNA